MLNVNFEANFDIYKEEPKITELLTQRKDYIPYLKSLVNSMPRRLEVIIRIDGNSTKY